ncbi:S-adenosyl-L-methionine-dependent methyltransferases superfamilyprotein [Zostera marina]|uniref:S-adenosyl-L-methionine-dependent methyltransferases superfamilyprotein n=1 Tax=Zostera marina TaxID=29655 RepID=A0A0K9NKQ9_ZOSMR|nr:S-adenosyl-L-methionine-dependent methyltransferases superfamilyprotein [Zostera marina]
MEYPVTKSRITARNLVVRSFLLGVLILILRFVYVVTVYGGSCASDGFCFFSSSDSVGMKKVFVEDGDVPVEWRRAVDFYSDAFNKLVMDGYLSRGSKSLCVGSTFGHDVMALKIIGVEDVTAIGEKKSPPLVVSANLLNQPFGNASFDFVFVDIGVLEGSESQAELATEVSRVLKPGWFLVVHTSSCSDAYSLHSFAALFPTCRILRSGELAGSSSVVREIVLEKREDSNGIDMAKSKLGKNNECSIPETKLKAVKSMEPLIPEEPVKPWITLKKNIQNIKYLPSMVDISFKRRYVYIDVGARNYGSSIGSWFKKQYPKQNRTFEIYAIEADKTFHPEYAMKKGIKLMGFAAYVRNETLSFQVSHNPIDDDTEGKGSGMGRIQPTFGESSSSANVHSIQGFDFAEWLKNTVTEEDFVVLKMDVEGTEFDLIPMLLDTGAICLVDEFFLECHYNRWQRCCPGKRSPKYQKTYDQCLDTFSSLRNSGVLVHQWW